MLFKKNSPCNCAKLNRPFTFGHGAILRFERLRWSFLKTKFQTMPLHFQISKALPSLNTFVDTWSKKADYRMA